MLLTSIRALITRPQTQANSLAEAIKIKQGKAWVMPMLAITPTIENHQIRNTLLSIDSFQKIIVTSHHAASFGLKSIKHFWSQLPNNQEWYAIGPKTASMLNQYDIDAIIPFKGSDSESLLKINNLSNIIGTKILVMKGQGGRSIIEETLKIRGAKVECLDTYQRQTLNYSKNTIPNLLKRHKINVIICASGETVTNLLNFLPKIYRHHLCLIVPSKRVEKQFTTSHFNQLIVADGACNEAMLSALLTLQQQTYPCNIQKYSEKLS